MTPAERNRIERKLIALGLSGTDAVTICLTDVSMARALEKIIDLLLSHTGKPS